MSKPRITSLEQIKNVLGEIDLLAEMESGFIAYSRGDCVIPPVGELIMDDDPPGEVHIKYGYERGGTHYVIKIASSFPGNSGSGLPSGNGMMLLFDMQTGELADVLLDEAHLTDVRTGAAGALASRTLAPSTVDCIGVIGTGVQGREQLRQCASALGCTRAIVCGRREDRLERFVRDFSDVPISIETTTAPREIAERCRVIVTCTPAREPLIEAAWVAPGTHITAIGSDTPAKQELEASLLARADVVVVDSIEQARLRGEVSHALRGNFITEAVVSELGAILAGTAPGRTSDEQVTIADLTGVAVQDLRIARAVSRSLGIS